MKKPGYILLFFISLIFFSSCHSKTVELLSKKWDCVQVENIVDPGTKFQSAEDSADAIELQSLLQSLNWTFKTNMRYECAVNSRVTVQGEYELLEQDKIMVCTPDSKNNTNRYIIKSLTEYELVLSTGTPNTGLILHFKPH